MVLTDRKQKILRAVVENYIDCGEAISSKALIMQTGLSVSSATIRNELADLVRDGYLIQPHTSAGRIPSHKGYRYYIVHLCELEPVSDNVKAYIERTVFSGADAPEKILQKTAHALSKLSSVASVTTTPSGDEARVHKIRFVVTGRHTGMVVLITSNGMVKNRLFRSDFVLTPELIAMFDKVINDNFVGIPLKEITKAFLQTIASKFGELSLFMTDVLMAILDASTQAMQTVVNVSGATNLLFLQGYDLLTARNVLKFLSDSELIAKLLSDNIKGTKVYLGKESGIPELSDSCVIVTRYNIGTRSAGAIALIGPCRADYKTLIPQLEYASECASGLIGDLLEV